MKHLLLPTIVAALTLGVSAGEASTATFNLNSANTSLSDNGGVLTLNFGGLGTITMTGYQCPYEICLSTPQGSPLETQTPLTVSPDGAVGLLSGTTGETPITADQFVTIDFSNFTAPITSVNIFFTDVNIGWDVYPTSVANQLFSLTTPYFGPQPIAQGNNGTNLSFYPYSSYPNINSTFTSTSTGYATITPTTPYVTVTALQDCEGCPWLEIPEISINYVPEPGTLATLLAGGALLGLGIMGRKRAQKTR